ncbi:hypothetical protein ANN_20828 [Periplaneta americana]|uniref:EF-hand domain-containing protein n=1 Tax=Periplaneta americana TaxID=6978 RepID=A0ABQ8SE23_PERAM|nr:hypothetical protein ANN_20828 [Periplaneta americana]
MPSRLSYPGTLPDIDSIFLLYLHIPQCGLTNRQASTNVFGSATLTFEVDLINIGDTPPPVNVFKEIDADKDLMLSREEITIVLSQSLTVTSILLGDHGVRGTYQISGMNDDDDDDVEDEDEEGRRGNPVPAHSLLLSNSIKRAARLNVPIRRTNHYQQKKGRPKLKWFDGVTDDLVALGVRNWRRKAQERQIWKRIVEDAKAHVWL